MRNLTASFFMSLDGVIDSPQDWHFPYQDEVMTEIVRETMASADMILLGRVTYEEWAAFWPDRAGDGGMGQFINETPKLVASKTLDRVAWENAALVQGDAVDAVRKLKVAPGGDVWVTGSGTLVRALLAAGVVDELRVLLHPVVVGRGKHLFQNGGEPMGLELVAADRLDSGVLDLRYAPS